MIAIGFSLLAEIAALPMGIVIECHSDKVGIVCMPDLAGATPKGRIAACLSVQEPLAAFLPLPPRHAVGISDAKTMADRAGSRMVDRLCQVEDKFQAILDLAVDWNDLEPAIPVKSSEWLRRRALNRQCVANRQTAVLEQLRELASDLIPAEERTEVGRDYARLSVLLARPQLDLFRAKAGGLVTMTGRNLTMTAPWPVFSFAELAGPS